MSTKNKSLASQALLEMDTITSAIKEESKKSLNSLLSEAVKNALRESCNEEDEEDDYEVIDDEKEKSADNKKGNSKKEENEDVNPDDNVNGGAQNMQMAQPQSTEPQMGGSQQFNGASPEMPQGEEGDSEEGWDEFSDYKVGNSNTYDLTGENDYETVVKVYKRLNDEDHIIVKSDGNTIQLQDNDAGTEYVIDLGGDENASTNDFNSEEMPEGINESTFEDDEITIDDSDMAGFPDNETEMTFDDSDDGFSFEISDDDEDFDDDFEFSDDDEELFEGKIRNKNTRKPMRERKEVLFEVDLGYTDNYQDKDPIAGLSNNEPSKSGKSWHKGVPTGTSKPWAGETKSKGDPFKETQKVEGSVNEEDLGLDGEMPMDEAAMSNSSQASRHKTKSKPSNGRKDYLPYVTKSVSTADSGYEAEKSLKENKDLKAIKNENKELKKAIVELRKSLNEAYITNVNLGKITKLFLENATSKEEKAEIVNRFTNEAKTLEQSNALYESIDKQLKKKQQINLNETSVTPNGTKTLNEQPVYKSKDLIKTIDLMGRVMDC